jgi:hypothetical protein
MGIVWVCWPNWNWPLASHVSATLPNASRSEQKPNISLADFAWLPSDLTTAWSGSIGSISGGSKPSPMVRLPSVHVNAGGKSLPLGLCRSS